MDQSRRSSIKGLSTSSKQAPPPLKPLPPIPGSIYFMVVESAFDASLLSHPVPSPSLCVEEMMSVSHGIDQTYPISTRSVSPQSTQGRDSTNSLMEFIETLLLPAPVNDMENCLVESKLSRSSTITSASQEVISDDWPDQLCREMSRLEVQRCDSAMLSSTQIKPQAWRWEHPVMGCQHPSPPSTASSHPDDLLGSTGSSIFSQPMSSSTISAEDSERGQTSFMEWDDEVSRLARVKKSFADLKTAARTRSNSVPLVTTQTRPPLAARQVSVQSDSGARSIGSVNQRPRSSVRRSIIIARPRSPLVMKRDSAQFQRTSAHLSSKRTTLVQQSNASNHSTTVARGSVPSPVEGQRDNRVRSYSRKRRRGLDNLSCWMRKVMRLS